MLVEDTERFARVWCCTRHSRNLANHMYAAVVLTRFALLPFHDLVSLSFGDVAEALSFRLVAVRPVLQRGDFAPDTVCESVVGG